MFIEIQKAYETLADPKAKAIYDLALLIQKPGSISKKNLKDDKQLVFITENILNQIRQVDFKNIDQALLFNYMNWLLNKETCYFLLKKSESDIYQSFFRNAIQIINNLEDRFKISPLLHLQVLCKEVQFGLYEDAIQSALIEALRKERKRKRLPYVIFVWSVFICLFIFLAANWQRL